METTSNKYQNGKIYKIVDIGYNKCYYGSTIQPLSARMGGHRRKYIKWKNDNIGHTTVYNIFDEFGINNCKIELVELFSCSCKPELEAREGYHIKNNECVNKLIMGRSKREYYEDNKCHIKERNKEYAENNKEKVRLLYKQYYEMNKDKISEQNRQYYEDNKGHIKERNKAYAENNIDKVRLRYKQYCEINKDKIREQKKKQYNEANKDAVRERWKTYYRENKDVIKEKSRKYREAKRNIQLLQDV